MSLKHEVLHAIYPKGIPTDHIGEKLDRIQQLAEAIERVYSGKRPLAPKAPVGEKPAYVDKIAELRKKGLTYEEIAVALQSENIVISGSQVEKRIRRYHPELLGHYEEWRKAREESGLPPVERGPPVHVSIETVTFQSTPAEDLAALRSAAESRPEPVRTGSELPCSAGTANNIAAPIESEKAEDITYSEVTKEVNPGPSEQKVEAVTEPPALQEAEPEHSENASTPENQIAQKAEEAEPKLELGMRTMEELTDEEYEQLKERVYGWSDEDFDVKQISEKLRAEAIDLPWPKVRAILARRAKEEKAARGTTLSPEAEKARLEGKIWNLYTQAKMSPMEIAGHLTVRLEEVEAIIAKLQGHK